MNRLRRILARARKEGTRVTKERIRYRLLAKKRQSTRQKSMESAYNADRPHALQALLGKEGNQDTQAVFLSPPAPPWHHLDPAEEEARASVHVATALNDGDFASVHPIFSALPQSPWNHGYPNRGKGSWENHYYSEMGQISGEDCPGDVRLSWELGRQQYLLTFARAWENTQDPQWLRAITSHCLAWREANPFLHGIHWIDAQEVSLRLKSWLRALPFVWANQVLSEEERQTILETLWQKAAFISSHLSVGPVTHNHLLTELCGLIHFCQSFPKSEFALHRNRWEEQLLREIDKQFWTNGAPGEGSTNYHFFVLENLLVLLSDCSSKPSTFSDTLRKALDPLVQFAAQVMRSDGSIPLIGDADSGRGTVLSDLEGPESRNPTLALANALLPTPEKRNENQRGIRYFPHMELYILGMPHSRQQDSQVTFVGGPREKPGVYTSHHHADNLSLQLWRQGETILADPGTYSYNGSLKDRVHSRQSKAHSTITVGEASHMDVESARFGVGPRPLVIGTSHHSEGENWSAVRCHIHAHWSLDRTVVWFPEFTTLVLVDQWKGKSRGEPTQWLQFGHGVTLEPSSEDTLKVHPQTGSSFHLAWYSASSLEHKIEFSPSAVPTSGKPAVFPRYGTHHPAPKTRLSLGHNQQRATLLTVLTPENGYIEEAGHDLLKLNFGRQRHTITLSPTGVALMDKSTIVDL